MTSTSSATLGELCSPKQWPTLSKGQMVPKGFPVYGANGRIGYSSSYTHLEPTILIGCRGSCGTVHVTLPRSYANGNAMALDAIRKDLVDIGFLAHFLRQRGFSDVTTGTSQPQIIARNLTRIKVPLPPLAEQRQIALSLDEAQELRSMQARAQTVLESLNSAIFYEMFGDPLTNPKKWPCAPFGSVCDRVTVGIVVRPASYYRPQGVPALRSLNIKRGRILLDNLVYFSDTDNQTILAKSRLRQGDVVIVRSGQPGTAAVVPPSLAGVNAIDILIASPSTEKCDPEFICAFLNSQGGQAIVLGAQRGQVQKHLNAGSLNEASIPLPPLSLQRDFAECLAVSRRSTALRSQVQNQLDGLTQALNNLHFAGFR